jgi:hypothetical protein
MELLPPKDSAARPVELPSQQLGFRLCVVAPVDSWVVNQTRNTGGHVYEGTAVGAAGLEQQYTQIRSRRESIGESTSGRACACDDVVVYGLNRWHQAPP